MDTCFPDWDNQFGLEFPVPAHKKPFTSENDLVELLWQNGELVMQSQNSKKPSYDANNQQLPHEQVRENPIDETVSWADFPIDVCFEKELCSGFLQQIQSPDRAGVPETNPGLNHSVPRAQPPPSSSANIQKIPLQRNSHQEGRHQMIMTVGSSRCASDLTNGGDTSSGTFVETCGRRTRHGHERTESEKLLEQPKTSSSNGSSFCKSNDRPDITNGLKRKMKDVEESERRSEATELESAGGSKSSQKSGMHRKSRVAEVHNLSERRRRDRINEKMKALQELIPHSTKSDKASMLDEAIEYMKSLQLQLQLLWMESGMAPPVMMLPGTGFVGPQTLSPAIQTLMSLSRLPLVDHAFTTVNRAQMIQSQAQMFGYHNQIKSSSFHDCIGFQGFQNSQQPMNVLNLDSLTAQQQAHVPAAPTGSGNGSGSIS